MTSRLIIVVFFSTFLSSCNSDKPQAPDSFNREAEIRAVLDNQVAAWNEGDLEKFYGFVLEIRFLTIHWLPNHFGLAKHA